LSLGFSLLELGHDALLVRLEHIVRNTFHAENFHVQTCSVGERILNLCELLLVNLAHVYR
jgi:hypothetical protein